MKRLPATLALLALLARLAQVAPLALGVVAPGAQAQTAVTGSHVKPLADDALYQAFGAEAGLNRLMDEFVIRLKADPRIGRHFAQANAANLKTMLAQQLCVLAGGPCTYTGAPMRAVHADLEIDKSAFNALVEVLQATMEAQGIPFAAQNRMLAQLAPMHRDVITKE